MPSTERSAMMTLSTDELLGSLLISTWSLTTGRRLRADVPPDELTEHELIEFWADDQLASAPPWHHRYARCQ
jgi:hypothetical protein